MADIQKYMGYGVGDIITLSDMQTQIEFDTMELSLVITETREYRCPNNLFNMHCYLTESPEDQKFLLMFKQVDNDFDIFLYFLDSDRTEEELNPLLTEDLENLTDAFEPTLHFDDEDITVTFQQKAQGSYHGVTCFENNSAYLCSIAEYVCNESDCRGNPLAFIAWSHNENDSSNFIELWYGCELKPHEVEISKGEIDD